MRRGISLLRSAGPEAAAPVLLLLVAFLFLAELVLLIGIPVARDMQLFFLPQKHLIWSAFQEGRLPLWTPYIGTGMPLLANFQSGIFYPPTWAYAVLPFFVAFNGLLVFHFALSGLFTYWLCRRLELGVAPSLVGALAFMLGGYFVSLTNLINVLQTAAWAPALILSVVIHQDRRAPGSFAFLVLVHLMAFLAGEPFTFLMAAALAALFGLLRCRSGSAPLRSAAALVGTLVACGLLVAGLSLGQLLPTVELVAESSRSAGLSAEEAGRYSLQPERLLHFVLPPDYRDPTYAFGRQAQLSPTDPWLFSTYLGVVVLLLALLAFRDPRRRMEAIFWAAAAGLGVLLGLGVHTPVFGWLYEHLPGFSALRYPERFLFLTGFGVAMLAAQGTGAVLSDRRRRRLDVGLAAAILSLGLLVRVTWEVQSESIYAWLQRRLPQAPLVENFEWAHAIWGANMTRGLSILVVAIALIALFRRARIRKHIVAASLVAAVAVDLVAAHRHLTPTVEASFYTRAPWITQQLPLEELRTDYRYRSVAFDERVGRFYTLEGLSMEASKWLWQQAMLGNLSQMWQALAHGTGDAIHLKRDVDMDHFFQLLPERDRWRLLQLGSVKYVYSIATRGDSSLYESRVVLDSIPGNLYTLRDPLPRAYVATEGIFFDAELEAFNTALRQDFDPHVQVALVTSDPVPFHAAIMAEERKAMPRGVAGLASASARILTDGGERVQVEVHADRPAFLVLTDSYYPGWRAVVDGEERPIYRANYFYRAVPIGPGDSEVVFHFDSAPFAIGWRASLIALLAAMGGLFLWTRARRRRVRDWPDERGGYASVAGRAA